MSTNGSNRFRLNTTATTWSYSNSRLKVSNANYYVSYGSSGYSLASSGTNVYFYEETTISTPDETEIVTDPYEPDVSFKKNAQDINGETLEMYNVKFGSTFMIDGSNDGVYERLTGVRGFSTVIKNVKNMISMGIDVRFNCSLAKENHTDMEGIFNVAKEMNLHIKTTPYMYPQTRVNGAVGENSGRLDPLQAAKCRVGWSLLRYSPEEFVDRANGMKKGIAMFEQECVEEAEPGKVRCRAGKTSFWINKNGEMSPCGIIDKSFDIKESGFSEAWKQVKEYTEAITLPPKCRVCKYRHFCNVCAAVCYTETGSYSSVPEYVCLFSAETARLTELEAERMRKAYED